MGRVRRHIQPRNHSPGSSGATNGSSMRLITRLTWAAAKLYSCCSRDGLAGGCCCCCQCCWSGCRLPPPLLLLSRPLPPLCRSLLGPGAALSLLLLLKPPNESALLPEPHEDHRVREGSDTSDDIEGREGSTMRGLVLPPAAAAASCGGVVARPCRPTSAHHTARASQLLLLLPSFVVSTAAVAAAADGYPS